ncbi:twin-arginine translocase TatA/TatE family subunit [Sulfurimonas sp. HSL1-2]|jgi:sec-independent protein translocase protein TatA|uniref:Sec-independent protein translocase subunit TatA/TatB n=1 Tax=Thiomicrolovo zhangzhouensis TaxID=3131933 RepID=UPI0031F839D2
MGMPSGTELLLIFGIIVLLFGAKKIPDLAKGIGKGIKNFKNEMKDEPEEVASSEAPKKVEGGDATAASEAPKESEKQA